MNTVRPNPPEPYSTDAPAGAVAGMPARASRWVLPAAGKHVWHDLRSGCRAVPGRAWRRWGGTLLIGVLVCGALSVGVTRLARSRVDRGLQSWDERWLRLVEEKGPFSFPNAVLAESPGNLAYLIPLTVAASLIAIRMRRPLVALTIQAAYWGVRPIVLAGWQTWDRARPTLIGDGIAAPGLHSFPSGHAALSTAVYGFLIYLWLRRSRSAVERALGIVVLLAIVGAVSVARVRLGSHWPSDIIAGAAIGAAWLAFVIFAFRAAERTTSREV